MSYVIRVLQVHPAWVSGKFRTATVIQSQGEKRGKKELLLEKPDHLNSRGCVSVSVGRNNDEGVE